MTRRQRVLVGCVVWVATIASTACASDESAECEVPSSGDLTIAAASSLTDAFAQIGQDYEAANPDQGVSFVFDSSSNLADQIDRCAPYDVFASADLGMMAPVAFMRYSDGVSIVPQQFTTNRLVIAVPPGNPESVSGLDDLVSVDIVALCAADAPCGQYATAALDGAGVILQEDQVTRGTNARATASAVADGDAGAALVYRTDVLAAEGALDVVAIRDATGSDIEATYAIVALGRGQSFVDHVLSPEGQATLREFGFGSEMDP